MRGGGGGVGGGCKTLKYSNMINKNRSINVSNLNRMKHMDSVNNNLKAVNI